MGDLRNIGIVTFNGIRKLRPKQVRGTIAIRLDMPVASLSRGTVPGQNPVSARMEETMDGACRLQIALVFGNSRHGSTLSRSL